MSLRTILKLGETKTLSDARYASACGAEFLGFNFSPQHPQYMPPSEVGEILGWIQGPKIVGEWEGQETEIIRDTHLRLHTEYIQLNDHRHGQAAALKDFNVIQNISVTATSDLHDVNYIIRTTETAVNFYMLTMENEVLQEKWLNENSAWLAGFCRDYHVFFNWHFNERNLLIFIDKFNPYGINLHGSDEDKVGYKDFTQLNDLVELLETHE
ncbi:MAG: hypothetical protein M3Q97_09935 [Bacteroidota bacterium]|nr:hypothetical protein [Bacteroidota bacterium]